MLEHHSMLSLSSSVHLWFKPSCYCVCVKSHRGIKNTLFCLFSSKLKPNKFNLLKHIFIQCSPKKSKQSILQPYLQDLDVTGGEPSPGSILLSLPPASRQSLDHLNNLPCLEAQSLLVLLPSERVQTFAVRSRHDHCSLKKPHDDDDDDLHHPQRKEQTF